MFLNFVDKKLKMREMSALFSSREMAKFSLFELKSMIFPLYNINTS